MEILLPLMIVALVPIYLLPSIVAFVRKHPNRWLILLLNAFFGLTGIAWVACMIWAMLGTGEGLEQLFPATKPFEGFLGELWTIWARDAGRAVLLARWSWQKLPEELVQQAALLQRQAQAAQSERDIQDEVTARLGSMGIFPGSGSGPPFGVDPDRAMFIVTMGTIRAHRGNPPASLEMVQVAEPVLRGQLDPVQAMIGAAPPSSREALAVAEGFLRMPEVYPFIRLAMISQAASSLPRERIPVLLPEVI